MQYRKILERGKPTDFIIISVITLLFLFVIAMNVRLIFQMTSNQIEEIGRMQIEKIRNDIEGKILNYENATIKLANETEKLMAAGATQEELTRFFYQKKKEAELIFNGVCFNTYIANKNLTIIPDFDRPSTYHATERLWYIGAVANPEKFFITEPYPDAAGNGICLTISKTLHDKETVVALDFYLEDLQDTITKMTEGSTRTALIVSQNGMIVGYTDMNLVSQKLSQKLPQYQEILERIMENPHNESFLVEIDGEEYTIFSSQTKNGWYMIVGVDNFTLYKESYRQTVLTLIISVAMLFVIVFFYLRSVAHRLESENALRAKEEFLSKLSRELKTPLRRILKLSKADDLEIKEEPAEIAAKVQESALQLSDMIENLFSFSNIVSNNSITDDDTKKMHDQEMSDASKFARMGIIVVVIFAIVVSMFFCIKTTINWGDTKMNREVDEYEFQLSNWMERQKSIVNAMANVFAANPEILKSYDETIKFLNDFKSKYDEISVCYMANPAFEVPIMMNNGWIPSPEFSLETRPWYIGAEKSADGFCVSPPYYDAQTGLYCLTISQMVYGKDNEFIGIFAVDFFLDKLIHILDASYTPESYAFLVDKDGVIVSHPNKNYQMNTKTSIRIEDTEYRHAYDNEGKVFVVEDYTNSKMACLSKKNELSNFMVIVGENWWEIYGNTVNLGIVFVVLLIICIVLVVILIEKILNWQKDVNARLKASADEAVAASNARSQFLAQMSHEIRTPMNAVLGMNELILRESKNKDILEYSENIQSAGRTLLSLINSILDFSKIENGQMKIVPVRYESAILINDLVTMASERASKKGLDLMIEIDKNLPRLLFGDDLRVKQIITNLLTNAIKYTPKGTVDFKVQILSMDDENIEILVSVKDTGIGIRQEDISKLSVSFVRLDEEKNRNIEGTGLGIAIVQKLLIMMGSKLEVSSVYGEGSTFSFKLHQKILDKTPIENYKRYNSEKIETDIKNKKYFDASKAKILVVDDNSMNLKVIRGILKFNGVVPDLAESGKECLELLAKNRYDIIFLDHMMPEMDGIETLAKIKEKHFADGTIIIALTANAISGAREFYLNSGFVDYLSKPINPGELDTMLKKYLDSVLANREEGTANRDNVEEVKPAEEIKTVEPAEEIEEVAEDSFTDAEKKFLNEICPEINLAAAMLCCMDSKSFFVEMVQEFFEGNKIDEINKFYAAEDWKNYRILVHALKSTSLVIGAESFSEKAKAQEFAAKENRIDDLKKNHDEFIICYEKFLNQIGNWLKETSNAKDINS